MPQGVSLSFYFELVLLAPVVQVLWPLRPLGSLSHQTVQLPVLIIGWRTVPAMATHTYKIKSMSI